MKLCIDCKHCYVPAKVSGFTIIPLPEGATCRLTDPVDGSGRSGSLCVVERNMPVGGHCGPLAHHYDPDGRADERRTPRGIFKEAKRG